MVWKFDKLYTRLYWYFVGYFAGTLKFLRCPIYRRDYVEISAGSHNLESFNSKLGWKLIFIS